jgi:outer membrane protein insertion porin family
MDGEAAADRRQASASARPVNRLTRRAHPVLLACILTAPLADAQSAADRIYVRRIELRGVERTNDEVLRRELRQVEGTFLNPAALEESRIHLERLPSVERARIAVIPVPGSENVVDVIVTITEEPTRRYSVGGGYASALGTSLNGNFSNDNLFGSGQQFSVAADVGELGALVEASYTNPYAFDAGVSRTIGVTSRDLDQLTSDASSIDADLSEARLEYGYPIGARQSIRLGLALRETSLGTEPQTSMQLRRWIAENGEPLVTNGALSTELAELDLLFRWRHDTRNREGFPEQGLVQSIDARAALPASDVEYFTVRYDATRYWTVGGRWTASVHGIFGYGDAVGDTTALPPYLNAFAGGPSTVRGYRGLGPKDSLGNPYGGDLLVATQLELKTAWPRRWSERMRSGFFFDVGNVYSTGGTEFYDASGRRVDYGFDSSELRVSAGIAADLLMPFGTVRLSYGIPLNASDGNGDDFLRDRTERFQISLGVGF